jgi:hypothetical protein
MRDYRISAVNKNIEVAPSIEFTPWSYNGG